MKRSLTALFALGMLALVATPAQAQLQLGLALGSDTDLGIHAGYYVPFALGGTEGLAVGIDGAFYLPEENTFFGTEVSYTYLELNANAHYPFYAENNLSAYALGGLNYSYVSVSVDNGALEDAFDDSAGDIGVNLGAGGEFGLGGLRLFGELKYTLGGFDQLGAVIGLRFGGRR